MSFSLSLFFVYLLNKIKLELCRAVTSPHIPLQNTVSHPLVKTIFLKKKG